MRITIETQTEGRILLEPEKLAGTETQQLTSEEAPIDGGAPSDELVNAIAGSAESSVVEEMESEDVMSMEDTSAVH